MHINGDSIKKVQKAVKGAADAGVGKVVSREMEMIPKYLELAKNKLGEYRFNRNEVKELTKSCGAFETNLSKTDVIKELLAIGEKENTNLLSADEMVGFLNATTGMKQIQQKNVLKFLKTAQEKIPTKVTREYLMEKHPYSRYWESTVEMKLKNSRGTCEIDEQACKKDYERFISSEMARASNPYYRTFTAPEKSAYVEKIKSNNKHFVETVASCFESDKLVDVFDTVGVTDYTMASADSLVQLFNLSSGNKNLLKDATFALYPHEIKQMAEVLTKEQASSKNILKDYFLPCYSNSQTIQWTRGKMMSALNLEGKMKLKPFEGKIVEDVYPKTISGDGRGRKISGGNYERGKKK